MSRLAAYSAGNKTYGGGRPHPTSGPVDPAGYIERGANKQASNRRSGLAAAATRRLQGAATAPPDPQAQQVSQSVRPQPSYAAPIVLSDGRKIMANASGQYTFVENEAELGGMQ